MENTAVAFAVAAESAMLVVMRRRLLLLYVEIVVLLRLPLLMTILALVPVARFIFATSAAVVT